MKEESETFFAFKYDHIPELSAFKINNGDPPCEIKMN